MCQVGEDAIRPRAEANDRGSRFPQPPLATEAGLAAGLRFPATAPSRQLVVEARHFSIGCI